ncbi:MAG: NAD-dependent epimerase/dehydratase family protein [Elusimicrobiota bacterium]|jgi:nucleoside-diphosphate-sugar epimerase|nr:NAD-dependent epimerase/dehydratase family protein [Elusimicrobiota bacterium]
MPTPKKKVIVTGASGLIGKETIEPLKKLDYEIYALTRSNFTSAKDINWINCDIFSQDDIERTFKEVKATHLLSLAWATTGDYLSSNINFDYLKSGLEMLKHFSQNGGKRAVFAGTVFEYDYKDEPLKETDLCNPVSVYAKCKNHLRQLAEIFCKQNNISFGWGRIFYVYGLKENLKRLVAHTINSLKNDKEVVITNGSLIRDYVFSKDIAAALVKFLDTQVCSIVNIATSKGISLGDFALLIADKLNKRNLIKILYQPVDQPKLIVGDNTRLASEVGYKMEYDYQKAIDCILDDMLKDEKK